MKYDKDTMNSLQEAYASVNEVKYYSGKDRNKKTGNPKELKNQSSTTSNKKSLNFFDTILSILCLRFIIFKLYNKCG